MKRSTVFLFATALSLSVAACNVFDGLYDEGSSSKPTILLADARTAMQDGRVGDAVKHLKKAHEKHPENIEVRVELASALLTQHKIDVILISELAEEIETEVEGASKRMACSDEASCKFHCSAAKSAEPFSYHDSEAYRKLEAALDVLEDVETLVSVPLEELGAQPGRRFDSASERKALFEALVAKIEQTRPTDDPRRLAARLLLNAGIATLSTTVANLEQSATELDVTLYHVERMNGARYVSYCGADVDLFLTGAMCPASTSALFTLDLLETRLENFTSAGGTTTTSIASELVEAGHELFDGLSSEIAAECGA